jgi:hypothetical protein
MTAMSANPTFGPRGLLDVQTPAPRGLLDVSRFDANIRQSAADAVRNPALPPLPEIAPLREPPRPYRGLEMAAQGAGMAMDGNNVATHGAKEVAKRIFRAPDGFDIVRPLSKGLGRVGNAATVLQEGFGAADDIERGVPKNVAIPGAIYRGSAALGMSALGGLIGSMFLPGLGTALGAAAGGLLADKLPSREFLGREVPKAMEEFGRHPYYDGGF